MTLNRPLPHLAPELGAVARRAALVEYSEQCLREALEAVSPGERVEKLEEAVAARVAALQIGSPPPPITVRCRRCRGTGYEPGRSA